MGIAQSRDGEALLRLQGVNVHYIPIGRFPRGYYIVARLITDLKACMKVAALLPSAVTPGLKRQWRLPEKGHRPLSYC